MRSFKTKEKRLPAQKLGTDIKGGSWGYIGVRHACGLAVRICGRRGNLDNCRHGNPGASHTLNSLARGQVVVSVGERFAGRRLHAKRAALMEHAERRPGRAAT